MRVGQLARHMANLTPSAPVAVTPGPAPVSAAAPVVKKVNLLPIKLRKIPEKAILSKTSQNHRQLEQLKILTIETHKISD